MSKSVLLVPNTKRSLKYHFSDAEKLSIAKTAAELHEQHEAVENDKKRIVADFSARLASIENDQGIAARKINSGYEYRDIECSVELDAPSRGQKTLTRLDDGTMAGVEMMSDADRQLLIKFEEDSKPKATKKVAVVAAAGVPETDEPARITCADSAENY